MSDKSPKKDVERRDVRQEVTDSILAKLEQGVMPWRKGWADGEPKHGEPKPLMLPQNGESGKAYRGGNRLYLMSVMHSQGYDDPRFMTFNQLRAWEAGPQKGSRGYPVEYWERLPFWKRRDVEVSLNGVRVQVHEVRSDGLAPVAVIGADRREVPANHFDVRSPDGCMMRWAQAEKRLDVLYAKHSTVFNIAQCQGLEKYLEARPFELPQRTEVQLDASMDGVVKGMQATGLQVRFKEQNHAFYRPSTDMIMMPDPKQFEDVREFRSTLLHELGHATGHASRLNREGIVAGDGFGGPKYAREELVAELTSAFMSAETGIDRVDDNHVSYISHWMAALKAKDGKHVLYEAAREADKATDYMLDASRSAEVEQAVERPLDKAQDREGPAAPPKRRRREVDHGMSL